jgi:guanine deaminase
MEHKKYMKIAIDEAYEGIHNHDGGPFGAVIVKDGKIIGRGHNSVLKKQDATCHGEMEAIRDASKNIGSYDLSGSVLYTTAAPCPMCKGAVLWANIEKVYYGCGIKDTDRIGFRDEVFYQNWEQTDEGKADFGEELEREACLKLFDDYEKMEHIIY